MAEILYKLLSDEIIRHAIDVQRELGRGFLEKVYENALAITLQEAGIVVEQQKNLDVYFRGHLVGEYVSDIVVENKIILELKAIERLKPAHYAQLINYLKASDLQVGYVINFGRQPLQFKRLAAINAA